MSTVRVRRWIALAVATAAALALMGCGSAAVNKAEIAKIKTVAVVVYTVPAVVEYKDDPRGDKSESALTSLAKAALKVAFSASGEDAASTAYPELIEALNDQGLPFRVLSADEVLSNAKFKELDKTGRVEKPKSGMASAMSFLGGGSTAKVIEGYAPRGLAQFGLNRDWSSGQAMTAERGEREYVLAAIKALGVDAALVIADPGFSFSCKACVGVGPAMVGNASTASAFQAQLVLQNGGSAMTLRQWFATTPASAPMAAGVVAPGLHPDLFKAHGKRTAEVIAEQFKEAMAEG